MHHRVELRPRDALLLGLVCLCVSLFVTSSALGATERARITWNTATDIDLHVADAEGNQASYRDPDGIPRAHLSVDDTVGFGPEFFTDDDAPSNRRFCFSAHYFGPGDDGIATPTTTVSATLRDPDGTSRSANYQLELDETADLGCSPPEPEACRDGLDNDFDERVDFGSPGRDPGCASLTDNSEECPGVSNISIGGHRSSWWQAGRALSTFATDDAVCSAIWTPKNDLSFVPQGIALVGGGTGTAYLSGYRCVARSPSGKCPTTDTSLERCELLHVSLSTGQVLGRRLPPQDWKCKHGGGIAIGGGRIWLADTKRLFALRWFNDPRPGILRLCGNWTRTRGCFSALNGSFLAERGQALYIGHYREDSPSSLHRFSYADLRAIASKTEGKPLSTPPGILSEAYHERGELSLPARSQGAAFVDGELWVSVSTSSWGRLATPRGVFEFGPGSEEIAPSANGSLWGVFEAGSRKYTSEYFPLVARFDPGFVRSGWASATAARK